MKIDIKKINKIVMYIAGGFLIVASSLKINQMLTEPIISKGFWESWEFSLIQIPLELGLGIWLVCGLFRKAAWLLGTIAYFGFICVISFKALTGAESCGCFGAVHVKPWITLCLIDIPIFLMMVIFRPKGEKLLPPPWPKAAYFLAIALPTFILLPTIEYTLITNKQTKPAAQDWLVKSAAEQKTIWPLLKDIDISDKLSAGVWVVFMYHNDCPTCKEMLPKYLEMQKTLAGNEDAINFAFIEMPPYEVGELQLIPSDANVTHGKLSDKQKWFYETPVVVVLNNGIVANAYEGQAPGMDELLNAAFGQQ
ncbi:MAG: MauE/DoxX family redox-associated membrane protein [Phycisphaerae bacterium]|jgi:thiol-disulfide isomerase/thioredoxin